MHGYLFTASAIRSQVLPTKILREPTALRPQIWNTCDTMIACADTVDQARKLFEAWLCPKAEGENPQRAQIDKLFSVQFQDEMLTETGNVPIDWPQYVAHACEELESNSADDFEQGYWLDVNAVIRPGPGIEALRLGLPEDIRSGLNWSPDKQYLFLISVLMPPPAPVFDPEADLTETSPITDEPDSNFLSGLVENNVQFPQFVDKATALVVRARNAAVAVWLWRKHSAGTKLAQNQIRIDPWCGAIGPSPG